MEQPSNAYFSAAAMSIGLSEKGVTPGTVANSMPRYRFVVDTLEKAAASSNGYDGANVSEFGLATLASQPNSILDTIKAKLAPKNLPVMVGSIGVAGIIGEGAPLPVLGSLDRTKLENFKTGGIAVFDREVVQHGSSQAESFFSKMMVALGVRSSNAGFIEVITNDPNSTTLAAADSGDFAGVINTISLATADLEITESSKLYLIIDSRTALNLSLKHDGGQLAFANLSVSGGECVFL